MRRHPTFVLLVVLAVAGCGAASYAPSRSTVDATATSGGDWRSMGAPSVPAQTVTASGSTTPAPASPSPPPAMDVASVQAESVSAGGGGMAFNLFGGGGGGDEEYAQNVPQHPPGPPPPPTPQTGNQHAAADEQARVADDAHRGPLLIYTATVYLSVFEVERTQRAVIDIARELAGFLVLQNDQQVTIRVPAAAFRDALARIEGVGDVLHRNVEAVDVSEEFRDLSIRMQNATAMRDRLQALLSQAHNAEEALAVERELERVTLEIEQIKGRLQFLGERLAYSTITVMFQPHQEGTDQPSTFRLPFPWLDQLTLSNLLNLPYQSH